MGLLDEIMVDDSLLAFGDTDGLAQSAVYLKGVSQIARTIRAVVFREQSMVRAGGRTITAGLRVFVPNHGTSGILTTELNPGVDRIRLAATYGGSTDEYPLGKPESQDAGGMMFRLA